MFCGQQAVPTLSVDCLCSIEFESVLIYIGYLLNTILGIHRHSILYCKKNVTFYFTVASQITFLAKTIEFVLE